MALLHSSAAVDKRISALLILGHVTIDCAFIALAHRCKIKQSANKDHNKKVIFLMSRRLLGVLTAIIVMLRSFHGVLIGNCLRSECDYTAFFEFCAFMALLRRSDCAEIEKIRKNAMHTQ
jgi:hypothetical protein